MVFIVLTVNKFSRIFAPEAPYKEPQQIKTIFMFLIRQLAGLKDPKDPAFKRYFYLLENLAYVKSFNMCHVAKYDRQCCDSCGGSSSKV